ncbi:hypothetical protein A0257_08230 [Hymenobacter psoromatis]|nr:hypothetical protein A0257_08230 [Hymenobacter psoromatis]
MLSIIICSRDADALTSVSQNIAATIGVEYELIAIDNSQRQHGICEAYNIGAAQATYSLLCFVHEDIAFRTNDWGKVVERVLLDNSIGVIGVIGGKWFPKAPGTWWACGNKYLSSNVLNAGPKGEYHDYVYSNPEDKLVVDVAVVDGMWMCTRKEVWQKHPFDSKIFPGFHFYDVDFCANIFPFYRVCVTLEIGVTHYSMGSYNDSWTEFADVFYRKHNWHLPLGVAPISSHNEQNLEYSLTETFVQRIVEQKLPARMALRYLLRCLRLKPLARHTAWLCWLYASYYWQHGWARTVGQR